MAVAIGATGMHWC